MAKRVAQLELDNQLCFALYDASRAATRAYAPVLGELGLTYPQYLVMLVLWEADGPCTVSAIGERLHLDSGTLTPLLKRLADNGLVERTRDAADERRVLITLTGRGGALRDRAEHVPATVFARYHLGVPEARALIAQLTSIVEALEAQ